MSHHHHATRDHRFAYISTGEISWARATSPGVRPECNKRVKRTFSPVTDIDALRAASNAKLIVAPVSSAQHLDALPVETPAPKRDIADDIDRTHAICDALNRRLMPHLFR